MRHRGGGVQQVYLSVSCPIPLWWSEFSCHCRYPELRELELKQLARALLSTDSGPALHALEDKIEAYSRGQLPHAKDVLPTLYELMESDEAFRGTPTQPPAPSKQDRIGRGRGGLKAALIQSLRSGSFLDSQFFALDSKPQVGTPTIRPIYLSSMVGSTFLSKLVKRRPSTPGLREYY